MSEQPKEKTGYMHELDLWTRKEVLEPIYIATKAYVDKDGKTDIKATVAGVQKAIREKMLESYRNGLKAKRKKK